MDAGVLVFSDLSGGELDDAGKGILAEGQRLAGMLGTSWGAVCFAGADDAAYHAFRPYGVPEVLEIHAPPELADLPAAQAEALAGAARSVGARVVLLAHTDLGATLAPERRGKLPPPCSRRRSRSVATGPDDAAARDGRAGGRAADLDRSLRDEGLAARGSHAARPPDFARVLSAVVLSTMQPGAAHRTHGRGRR